MNYWIVRTQNAGYWAGEEDMRGPKMSTASQLKRSQLQADVATAREQLRRAEEALQRLDRLPITDQWADGDVLMWTKVFGVGTSSPSYTYVAVRAGGRWYTTAKRRTSGDATHPLSWAELYEVMNKGGHIVSMFRMTRGERIV